MISVSPSASPLPAFTWELLKLDFGRLAPVGVVVVILAVVGIVVWLNEQRVAGKERRSVKRGN